MSSSVSGGPTLRGGRLARALRHPDVWGVLLALLYGLPTLGYAFGRDQALFFYIGREWTAWRLPYRDAFDVKPPGIYAVYGLAIQLFGDELWAIRVFELLGVLGMAALVSAGVVRSAPRRPGELGAAALLFSGFYFTCFDYWDTGQVEFWEGMFALAGYVAALRIRNAALAAVVSGVLGASAGLFKQAIVVALPMAGTIVVVRAYLREQTRAQGVKRALSAAGLHVVAGLATLGLVVGYFALRGGWPALVELYGYTATYVKNTPTAREHAWPYTRFFWWDVSWYWTLALPLLWLLGVALAARRRAHAVLGGAAIAALLVLLAGASVAVQLKYWSYHFVILAPFLALAAAYGIAELAVRAPRLALPMALVVLVPGHFAVPRWVTNPSFAYSDYTPLFYRYVLGQETRKAFLRPFVGPFDYAYLPQEEVGKHIDALARPGDRLHVRGFEPAIYAVADLASPSRFASEAPLFDPALAYNREAWVAEHDGMLWSTRPRFFVTVLWAAGDIANIQARGYHRLAEIPPFLILERD